MPKLRVLSGRQLLKIFAIFGFEKIDQRGSHVKIRRIGSVSKETLTIPMHPEIDKGLLKQIFMQASRYVPDDDLRKYFFN